jgi:acid phosphatase
MPPVPAFSHVVIVTMENHGFGQIIGASTGAPFINNTLVPGGALFTGYHAPGHPSFPNYFVLVSGSTWGSAQFQVGGDKCPPTGFPFAGANIASLLLAKGLTFRNYVENLPTNHQAADNAPYYGHHNPIPFFSNVPANLTVDFTTFPTTDPGYAALPTVSFIVPNGNNDMHDGTVTQGDTWLNTHFSGYAAWAKLNNSLLIVWWDEDYGAADNPPEIFYGANIVPGRYAETPLSHVNFLRTLCVMYGLTPPGGAATATPVTDIWTTTGPPPALTITTTTLPTAAAGVGYSTQLAAAGGVPPITWTAPVTSGATSPLLGDVSYVSPGGTEFTAYVAAAAKTRFALINPASGPGATKSTAWAAQVQQVKNAGIGAIGYVDTTNATRTLAAVQADVSAYVSFYGVSGILFDQVTTGAANVPYYQTLFAYVKAHIAGGTVILNAGTTTAEGYMTACDILANAETDYTSYLAWVPAGWEVNYDASRFFHVIHTAGTLAKRDTALVTAKANRAGTVFITDDVMANPYDTLPGATSGLATYWTGLLAQIGTPVPTGGGLPAGVTLSTGGLLSGTPVAAGSYPFTVRAADTAAHTATANLTLTVTGGPPPPPGLTITTPALAAAQTGTPYQMQLAAAGGTGPYTWSETGALPAGFTLSAAGLLSGTASTTGTFPLTFRVADSAGHAATAALNLVVGTTPPPPPPPVGTVIAMGGGLHATLVAADVLANTAVDTFGFIAAADVLPQDVTP